MSRKQAQNDRSEERPRGADFGSTPCCAEGVEISGRCGEMREMMQTGPCAAWLRRHRLAVYGALIFAVLGFLLLNAGWVLGIIAFFRTF